MQIEQCNSLSKLHVFLTNPPQEISIYLLAKTVQKALDMGVSAVRLADRTQVSEGTIKRYARGIAKPHRLIRKVVLQELCNEVEHILRQ